MISAQPKHVANSVSGSQCQKVAGLLDRLGKRGGRNNYFPHNHARVDTGLPHRLVRKQNKSGAGPDLFDFCNPLNEIVRNWNGFHQVGRLYKAHFLPPSQLAAGERFQRNCDSWESAHRLSTSQSVETAFLLDSANSYSPCAADPNLGRATAPMLAASPHDRQLSIGAPPSSVGRNYAKQMLTSIVTPTAATNKLLPRISHILNS